MTYGYKTKVASFLAIILLTTFLSYLPTLKSGFLNNDDNLHLYDNVAVRGLDFDHIKQIFTKPFNPTYVPLTTLSFAVEYHFFKYNPFVYHLNNLLLHLAVTSLIFYFALQIGLPLRAAFIGGLLFGIHPMHVESVAWVTERKDVLYSFFYMLAVCFYWQYLSSRKIILYIATIGFGVLSILAKSMALSLPLIFLVCDWYKKRQFDKWMILDKIPHFLYIIPIAMLTYLLNARNPIQNVYEAILFWVWCFAFYLQKFVWPVDLVLFTQFPKPFTIFNPEFAFSFLITISLGFVLWHFRRNTLLIFSFLFYLVSIFFLFRFDDIKYLPPTSNRFMYLPSVGFCFLFGYWIDLIFKKVANKKKWETAIIIFLIFIALMLCGKTFAQTKIWSANIPFWSHELKYYPTNAMALVNRGEAYKDAGKYQLAFADFNKAVEVDPDYAEGYNSRGQMLGMSGKLDEALQDFLKTLELKPNFDETYNNIGIIYAMKNDMPQAASYFQKALAMDPQNAEALYNLGNFHFLNGEYDQSFQFFQRHLMINPNSAGGYNKRGMILGMRKQYDLALADFNRSLALDPRNSEVYKNRGIVFEQKKMFNEAIANYNKALAIDPKYVDAYFGRGNVFAITGRYGEAAKDFSAALAINPDHEGAKMSQRALIKILTDGEKAKKK
ncbi:MAG: tetratricopeptide repeat protein [Candidatus Omnitrophica bacterium]|nr:tetratricopeptide repeat protein [Candidatus Omnitrophota bacterium]